MRWFSTFTQRSLGDAERVEIAPAAELAEEHRELAEIAALEDEAERPDIAELLPVDQFRELPRPRPRRGADPRRRRARTSAGVLRDHWEDVCAAFHDTDAGHLYVPADRVEAALDAARAHPA